MRCLIRHKIERSRLVKTKGTGFLGPMPFGMRFDSKIAGQSSLLVEAVGGLDEAGQLCLADALVAQGTARFQLSPLDQPVNAFFTDLQNRCDFRNGVNHQFLLELDVVHGNNAFLHQVRHVGVCWRRCECVMINQTDVVRERTPNEDLTPLPASRAGRETDSGLGVRQRIPSRHPLEITTSRVVFLQQIGKICAPNGPKILYPVLYPSASKNGQKK